MLVFLLFFLILSVAVVSLQPVRSASIAHALQEKCLKACPRSRHADFLRALVCGERESSRGEPAFFRAEFEKTGLLHLIIVSGTHLILLEALASRFVNARFRGAVVFSVLIFFVLASGASPPVLRAWFAFLFRKISHHQRWNWSRVQVITVAGFASVVFCTTQGDVYALFLGWIASLAFEFAFGESKKQSCAPTWRERRLKWRTEFGKRAKAQVAVYFALIPALLPMGVPSAVSIAANLIFAPVLALVLFPASCAAYVCPPLVGVVDLIWDFVLMVIRTLGAFTPETWEAVPMTALALVPYLFCLTLFFVWRDRRRRLRCTYVFSSVLSLVVGVSVLSSPTASAADSAPTTEPQFTNELIVWNIGQGSWATLKHAGFCQHFDMGGEFCPKRAIADTCRSQINQVYYSHWDWDHIGLTREGVHLLPNLCKVGDPGGPAPTKFKASLLQTMPSCTTTQTPPSLKAHEIFLSHLSEAQTAKLHDANDYSRVFIEDRIIFPGDSPKKEEKLWRMNRELTRARILIAGHHGSKSATSVELLETLRNVKMIVASAREARYGHPHPAMLARAREFKIPVLRTEDWGSLHFELKPLKTSADKPQATARLRH